MQSDTISVISRDKFNAEYKNKELREKAERKKATTKRRRSVWKDKIIRIHEYKNQRYVYNIWQMAMSKNKNLDYKNRKLKFVRKFRYHIL